VPPHWGGLLSFMSFGMLIAFSQRMIAAKALKKTYLGVSDEPALPLLRIRTAVAVATIVLMPTVGELFGEWLALLWQIYSCRRSLQIHFRQYGHRCGGGRAKSARMA